MDCKLKRHSRRGANERTNRQTEGKGKTSEDLSTPHQATSQSSRYQDTKIPRYQDLLRRRLEIDNTVRSHETRPFLGRSWGLKVCVSVMIPTVPVAPQYHTDTYCIRHIQSAPANGRKLPRTPQRRTVRVNT
ncbi:hypothetical protein PAAG_04411 [Paracoccidioides lutzii Pb01]|uniref:Uncharacterized protein n=1 Tax=Paracoccidioides lutzii (strain ATCC MYA-826 / Pb01) TaxID=502779 RepID=C1H0W7_PARBA|nr:hypothetical protein PAAG_04411 [Paracoccidioides lutzii Pb01]EEH33361.1 hypothetical protein PAAG_04411 [Paracoccidioides lutzii Pb01]